MLHPMKNFKPSDIFKDLDIDGKLDQDFKKSMRDRIPYYLEEIPDFENKECN